MARGLILTMALMILAMSPVQAQYVITATAVVTEPLVADAVTLEVRAGAHGLSVSAAGEVIEPASSSVLRRTYVTGSATVPVPVGVGAGWSAAADGRSLERREVRQVQFPVLDGRLPEAGGAAMWLSGDSRTLVVTRVVAANS